MSTKSFNRSDALLKLMIDIGGHGNRETINSKIPEYWQLNDSDLEIEPGVGKPRYWHRVASISQQLMKNKGFLEIISRGVWGITEEGKKHIAHKFGVDTNTPQTESNLFVGEQKRITTAHVNGNNFSTIKEEEFYEPFAEWIVKTLKECTNAISLGGKKFQDKWMTPDVIGIRELERGAYIQIPTEIISAEIKTSTHDLIQGFGQANAYKLFSHKSYMVIPKTSAPEDISRLDALSRICGIGLILFDNKSVNEPKFEILARATRHEPDMFYIDKNLKLIGKDLFHKR